MVFPYKVRYVICICTLCIQTVSGRKYVKKLIVPLPICGIEIQERYWGINAFNFVIFILFESSKNIIKKFFFNLLRVSARIISGFTIFGKLSFSSNFKQEWDFSFLISCSFTQDSGQSCSCFFQFLVATWHVGSQLPNQ